MTVLRGEAANHKIAAKSARAVTEHPNYEYFNCTVVRATSACAILANAGIHPLSRLTQRTCGSSSQRVVKQAERLPDFMPQRGAVPQTPVRKVLRP